METKDDAILVCTIGEAKGVVPATLNKLIERGYLVREVVMIHTGNARAGNEKVRKAVRAVRDEFINHNHSCENVSSVYRFLHVGDGKYGEEKNQVLKDKKEILSRISPDRNYLLDAEEGHLDITLKLVSIKRKDGEVVGDILSREDAEAAQGEVFRQVLDAKNRLGGKKLILSLSGGRNEMIGVGAMAAQCIGVDLLCQVTEVEEAYLDIIQPPLGRYDFVEIPFVNISGIIEEISQQGHRFKNLLMDADRFVCQLRRLSKDFKGITLLIQQLSRHELRNLQFLHLLEDDFEREDWQKAAAHHKLLKRYFDSIDGAQNLIIGGSGEAHPPSTRAEAEEAMEMARASFISDDSGEASIRLELKDHTETPDQFAIALPPFVVHFCLYNLIKNAVDQLNSDEGNTEPSIQIIGRKTEVEASLSVEDNGPGFGETESSGEGLGVGLELVRYLLEEKCGAALEKGNREDSRGAYVRIVKKQAEENDDF